MTYLCIGIRIHVINETPIQDYYLDNLLSWLKYREYDVESYTAGIHIATENPHIHIHCLARGKLLSNPVATFKRDYQLNKLPTILGEGLNYPYPDSLIGQKYKGKINLSIQMKEHVHPEDDGNCLTNLIDSLNGRRYLQYPLKEGLPLRHSGNLTKEFIEELMKNAQQEYKEAQERYEVKQQYKERKEAKELSEWAKLCDYLDGESCKDLTMTFMHALVYYRTNYDKPPTGKLICDNAERYCIKHDILSIDELVHKYIGKW